MRCLGPLLVENDSDRIIDFSKSHVHTYTYLLVYHVFSRITQDTNTEQQPSIVNIRATYEGCIYAFIIPNSFCC